MAAPACASPTTRYSSNDAVASLYKRHADGILAYCLRRLGTRAEAEDAVQTTFVYALRALRRGTVPECEEAWLTAIAKNICRWQRRTLARRPVAPAEPDLDRIGLAPPDEEERELLLGVREALRSIPPSQRRALVLREWHGLAPREIASELGLSPTATHALLTRARRSLAQALTAPKRAALGVASLAYELRFWIKAAAGVISVKAGATVTAVVVAGGAGAGGVVLERGQSPEGRTPTELGAPRTGAATAARVAPADPITERVPTPFRRSLARDASRSTAVPPSRLARDLDHEHGFVPVAPTLPRHRPGPTGDPAPQPQDVPGPAAPGADPENAALDPPALPELDPPSVDLPAVDVPPVDLPPLDLPALAPAGDMLPPVDLPPVDLPPVDLPPLDLPPVVVPPLDLSPLPTLGG